MTFIEALLLGLLQGLTEFLPVSSSGHLVLAQHFLDSFEQPGVLFDVILHLGTIGAVLVYFRADIGRLLAAPFQADAREDRRMLILIVIGSVPTAVIGLLGNTFLTSLFDRPAVAACMLLITGAILLGAEKLGQRVGNRPAISSVDAFLTGIAQGLAIIPGISRSGSTIALLLIRGIDAETAARFSFLLSIPAVLGASLLEARHLGDIPSDIIPTYLAGAGIAFFSGLCAIRLLLSILRKRRLSWFAFYCWIVGGLFLLFG
ncbi:MAG: UDP-diphosphatase [Desulfuromonas sp.]|nr:MAG: UDP-diphosphatase [Desulfuromonas sp.]